MAIRTGTFGDDSLVGTNGDDFFFGYAGNDIMNGGAGNDTFFAGPGQDTFIGGMGIDTVDYSGIVEQPSFFGINGIYVNLIDGLGVEAGSSDADYYSSIENVIGSNFNDYIVGDGNANVIRGGGGMDIIQGGGGGDTLDGGDGLDYLIYSDSTARVVVDLLNNTASGGYAQGDVISNFEGVQGSEFNDILSGTNGRNDINGGGGNDTITARGGDDSVYGGDGNDTISGGDGNDTLLGEAGRDTINGGSGNDRISGGTGNDTLTGGTGADTFVFLAGSQEGTDHITDFNVNTDVLEIDADGFGVSMVNYNPYTFTGDIVVSFAGGGSVVLDHMSIGDMSSVAGQIHLV